MNKKKLISLLVAAGVVISSIIFVIKSSSPFSKESYLEDYKEFIEKVSNENDSYSEDDWAETDETFEKYNEEWYNKFEPELSISEKLTITKYNAEYKIYRFIP